MQRTLTIIAAGLFALAGFCVSASADDASKTKPASKPRPELTRKSPVKPQTPLDKLNVQTTDTGDKERSRFELGLGKSKELYLYGDRSTIHPTGRRPGEDYQPKLPNSSPKESFGFGLGLKKEF